MFDIKVKDRIPSNELRERETRIRRYNLGTKTKPVEMVWACVAKKDNDWVKKCMEYGVEGARPRGRTKRTWTEDVQKDCQACKLNREDATDHSRRKLIKNDR